MARRVHFIAAEGMGPIGSLVSVHGHSCQVMSGQTAELCDMVICRRLTKPLLNRDNLTGPCADCGTQLQWRPHAPTHPPKLCRECAMERVDGQSATAP